MLAFWSFLTLLFAISIEENVTDATPPSNSTGASSAASADTADEADASVPPDATPSSVYPAAAGCILGTNCRVLLREGSGSVDSKVRVGTRYQGCPPKADLTLQFVRPLRNSAPYGDGLSGVTGDVLVPMGFLSPYDFIEVDLDGFEVCICNSGSGGSCSGLSDFSSSQGDFALSGCLSNVYSTKCTVGGDLCSLAVQGINLDPEDAVAIVQPGRKCGSAGPLLPSQITTLSSVEADLRSATLNLAGVGGSFGGSWSICYCSSVLAGDCSSLSLESFPGTIGSADFAGAVDPSAEYSCDNGALCQLSLPVSNAQAGDKLYVMRVGSASDPAAVTGACVKGNLEATTTLSFVSPSSDTQFFELGNVDYGEEMLFVLCYCSTFGGKQCGGRGSHVAGYLLRPGFVRVSDTSPLLFAGSTGSYLVLDTRGTSGSEGWTVALIKLGRDSDLCSSGDLVVDPIRVSVRSSAWVPSNAVSLEIGNVQQPSMEIGVCACYMAATCSSSGHFTHLVGRIAVFGPSGGISGKCVSGYTCEVSISGIWPDSPALGVFGYAASEQICGPLTSETSQGSVKQTTDSTVVVALPATEFGSRLTVCFWPPSVAAADGRLIGELPIAGPRPGASLTAVCDDESHCYVEGVVGEGLDPALDFVIAIEETGTCGASSSLLSGTQVAPGSGDPESIRFQIGADSGGMPGSTALICYCSARRPGVQCSDPLEFRTPVATVDLDVGEVNTVVIIASTGGGLVVFALCFVVVRNRFCAGEVEAWAEDEAEEDPSQPQQQQTDTVLMPTQIQQQFMEVEDALKDKKKKKKKKKKRNSQDGSGENEGEDKEAVGEGGEEGDSVGMAEADASAEKRKSKNKKDRKSRKPRPDGAEASTGADVDAEPEAEVHQPETTAPAEAGAAPRKSKKSKKPKASVAAPPTSKAKPAESEPALDEPPTEPSAADPKSRKKTKRKTTKKKEGSGGNAAKKDGDEDKA